MTPNTAQTKRYLRVGLRNLAGIAVLAIGLSAFRDLLDYDALSRGRRGSSELEDWFFRPSDSSSALIFGVALCLLYTRRRVLLRALEQPGWGAPAWILLAPAAILYAWALCVEAPDLLLISFALITLGGCWWLGGPGARRAMFLPALFLLLLVPLPAVFINQLIYPMQLAVAEQASFVLNLVGVESAVSETFIVTPNQTFQVIESCAGFRAMETLIMSALIYADLFYRSRLQTIILLLSAPLLAVLVNLGRVLSLVLNPYSGLATIHTAQGIAMLVIGVLLIAALDQLLSRLLPPDENFRSRWAVAPSRDSPREPSAGGSFSPRLAVLAVLLVSMSVTSLLIRPWEPDDEVWLSPAKLPAVVDGWRSRSLKLDKELLGSVAPKRWTRRRYARGDEQVELFVATDDRMERRTNLLSAKTALPESGFEIREFERVSLGENDPAEVDAFVLQRFSEHRLSYRWYLGVESVVVEAFRSFLALDRGPLGRDGRPVVIRVSTAIAPSSGGKRQANERLRSFIGSLRPSLEMLTTPMEL